MRTTLRTIFIITMMLWLVSPISARVTESENYRKLEDIEAVVKSIPKDDIGISGKLATWRHIYILFRTQPTKLEVYVVGKTGMSSKQIAEALDKAVRGTPYENGRITYIDDKSEYTPVSSIKIDRPIPRTNSLKIDIPVGSILARLRAERMVPQAVLEISPEAKPISGLTPYSDDRWRYYNVTGIEKDRVITASYRVPLDSIKWTVYYLLGIPAIAILGFIVAVFSAKLTYLPKPVRRIRYHRWSTTPALLATGTLFCMITFDSPRCIRITADWLGSTSKIVDYLYYAMLAGLCIAITLSVIFERRLLGPSDGQLRTETPSNLERLLYGRISRLGWVVGLIAAAIIVRLADIRHTAVSQFMGLIWIGTLLQARDFVLLIFSPLLGLPLRKKDGKLPDSDRDRIRILAKRLDYVIPSSLMIIGIVVVCIWDIMSLAESWIGWVLGLICIIFGPAIIGAVIMKILSKSVLKLPPEPIEETKRDAHMHELSFQIGVPEKSLVVDPSDPEGNTRIPIISFGNRITIREDFFDTLTQSETDYLLTAWLCREKIRPNPDDGKYKLVIYAALIWFAGYLAFMIHFRKWDVGALDWILLCSSLVPIFWAGITLGEKSMDRVQEAAILALEYTRDYASAVSALVKYKDYYKAQKNDAPSSDLLRKYDTLLDRLRDRAHELRLPAVETEKIGESL